MLMQQQGTVKQVILGAGPTDILRWTLQNFLKEIWLYWILQSQMLIYFPPRCSLLSSFVFFFFKLISQYDFAILLLNK